MLPHMAIWCNGVSWCLGCTISVRIMAILHFYVNLKKISFFEMLVCITAPICVPFYLLRSHFICDVPHPFQNSIRDIMIKELFVESYKCKRASNSDHFIFSDHWRLVQRLLLATIATFIINPLEKSCYFTVSYHLFESFTLQITINVVTLV